MLKAILLYSVLFLISLFLYFKLNINVVYTDYKEFIIVLLRISTMVFTLMGIWIAFLYPNALKRIVNPSVIENVDFSASLSETKRLESIVGSVLKSALVVISIMFIFLAKLLLSNSSLYIDLQVYFESVAVAIAIVLSWVQLESVFHVVKSNVMFINDLHKKREDREADLDV